MLIYRLFKSYTSWSHFEYFSSSRFFHDSNSSQSLFLLIEAIKHNIPPAMKVAMTYLPNTFRVFVAQIPNRQVLFIQIKTNFS